MHRILCCCCLLLLVLLVLCPQSLCNFKPFPNQVKDTERIPIFEWSEGDGVVKNSGRLLGHAGGGVRGEGVAVEQGYNFSITCSLRGMNVWQVLRLRIRSPDKALTIADNDDVKLPFSGMKRYSIKYNYHHDVTNLTLHYIGVMGQDSGILECTNLPSFTALLNLTVLVPISSMALSQLNGTKWHSLPDGEVLVWKETAFHALKCTAWISSSMTSPLIRLTADNQTLNTTHSFHIVPLPSSSDKHLSITSFNSSASATFQAPSALQALHGRLIRCTANSHQHFTPAVLSATLSVLFVPRVQCGVEVYRSRLNDNITMSCGVESNPTPQIQWYSRHNELRPDKLHTFRLKSQPNMTKRKLSRQRQQQQQRQRPYHHNHDNRQKTHNISQQLPPSKFIASITISGIREAHLGSYIIKASNNFGSSHSNFTLLRTPRPPKQPPRRKNSSRHRTRVKSDSRSTPEVTILVVFLLLLSSFLLLNQPINQPINLPINQSINQPINQQINQATNQPINQQINQPINQSINQPINQPTNQPTYLPTKQPIKRSDYSINNQSNNQIPTKTILDPLK